MATRDYEGSTARDYIDIYGRDDPEVFRQIIDNHVLDLVANDQHYMIETLLLDGYDHIMDIHGSKKHTSAREIAELKELKEMLILFDEFNSYKVRVTSLRQCVWDNYTIHKGILIRILISGSCIPIFFQFFFQGLSPKPAYLFLKQNNDSILT